LWIGDNSLDISCSYIDFLSKTVHHAAPLDHHLSAHSHRVGVPIVGSPDKEWIMTRRNFDWVQGMGLVATVFALSALVITDGLQWMSATAYATERGEERRDMRDDRQDDRGQARDTRQEGREAARDAKEECKQADDKSRGECRREKRDAKDEARDAARDKKRD
jgi:hypothetical protein